MSKHKINNSIPSNRDLLLRFIRRFCEPETCKAMSFKMFIDEIGNPQIAEKALKELWFDGLVVPTGTELDAKNRELINVITPKIEDKIKESSQFVLSDAGYRSIETFFDPYSDIDHYLKSEVPPLPNRIVVTTEFINEKLMIEIEKNPQKMLSLTPRQFEEFVAELFVREGYNVELTPERKDGGCDILAVMDTQVGTDLYMVECKRYSQSNPVGVEYVRSLYGVVEKERATRGIIAATSYFTKGAKEFSRELKWRIGLKNYDDLFNWIKKHTI